MRSFKYILSGIAAAILTIVSGGAAQAQQKAPEPLVINYAAPNALWWDVDVAIDKGFLKDEGFAPEATPFQNSPQAVQLLVTQSAQAAGLQPEALMDADLRGADIAAIVEPEIRPDWFFVVAPAIKTWSDLKGKNLGFSSLKVNEVWLTQKLLAAHGLGKSDWTALQVGITPLKIAALKRGSIAGAALFQPGAEIGLKDGLKALATYSELKGDFPPALIAVNRKWAATNENGVRFKRAFARAHQWLYDPANRAEAERILEKHTKASPEIAKQVYHSLFVTEKIYTRDGEIGLNGLKNALQLVAGAGEIAADKLPQPASLVWQPSGGTSHP